MKNILLQVHFIQYIKNGTVVLVARASMLNRGAQYDNKFNIDTHGTILFIGDDLRTKQNQEFSKLTGILESLNVDLSNVYVLYTPEKIIVQKT